ncbi:MAG TPA: flagellar export protein FliJ [Patescibacteria group bacterium]|nr:flagellar export protein FliJ [Patescibacteria group bacterium]
MAVPAKKIPADKNIDFNQYKRDLRKNQQADRQTSPEEDIADQYKQGAPMEGLSQSAGLTGGVGNKEARQKPPAQQTSEKAPSAAAPSAQTDKDQTSPLANPAEPEMNEPQPKTTTDYTRQTIARQKQSLAESQQRVEQARSKHEKNVEQKSWKRLLSGSRLRQREKELKRQKKQLARLEKLQAVQQGTGHLLKLSWLNLLPSFGITYLYIAFHFMMAYFTPLAGLFVKFGEEWIPKQAKAAGGQATKKATKGLELVEIGGCVLIGLLLLFIILGVFLIIALIVYAWENPLAALRAAADIAWEIIKCAVGGVFGAGESC